MFRKNAILQRNLAWSSVVFLQFRQKELCVCSGWHAPQRNTYSSVQESFSPATYRPWDPWWKREEWCSAPNNSEWIPWLRGRHQSSWQSGIHIFWPWTLRRHLKEKQNMINETAVGVICEKCWTSLPTIYGYHTPPWMCIDWKGKFNFFGLVDVVSLRGHNDPKVSFVSDEPLCHSTSKGQIRKGTKPHLCFLFFYVTSGLLFLLIDIH